MATPKTYHAIGLMCGSSMDGMDIAYCRFRKQKSHWQWEAAAVKAAAYHPVIVKHLKQLGQYTPSEFLHATSVFSTFQSAQVNSFLEELKLKKPDLIAWHGHTVRHNTLWGFSHQMGSGNQMAFLTQVPVITDLRANDMLLGGQGAPIVPIGDKHLFPQYPLLLNLGGIANITAKAHGKLFAFDICPLNQVLNHFAEKKHREYDDGGQLAAKGKVLPQLAKELSGLDYFRQPYPKSLDNTYTQEALQILNNEKVSVKDALATYCDVAAKQIALHIAKVERRQKISYRGRQLFITGGGAFNTHLVQRIAHYTKLQVVVPDENIVKFKEAIVMAFIGVLRMENTPNVLASVTGASRDSVNGTIHFPLLRK